ncbi:MAG: dihydroorotate dehydrogenase electron transfer subunit [Candidatus Omnitrophota bacterium]
MQSKYKIAKNINVGPDYFQISILAPAVARIARPGQFVHLRLSDTAEPLLRRPFSFHRINKAGFELFYKTIGPGTKLLAKKQKGDTIDVLGPLGNGFALPPLTAQGLVIAILVAGGMGVAPLLAWAEQLQRLKKVKLYALIGARGKEHLFCVNEFKKAGAKVLISTDDGSLGRKGVVTDNLRFLLTTHHLPLTTIYACGPKPMLREVARISKRYQVSAYGSLEENMACGVGACLGCVVKTRFGYQRVCKEGPVFNLEDILW